MASKAGIQNGESTHNQDQWITPHNFKTTNATSSRVVNKSFESYLEFLISHLFPSFQIAHIPHVTIKLILPTLVM